MYVATAEGMRGHKRNLFGMVATVNNDFFSHPRKKESLMLAILLCVE